MFRTGDLIRVKKQVGYAATGTACDRDPSEEGLFTTSSNFGDDIPSNVVSTFVVIASEVADLRMRGTKYKFEKVELVFLLCPSGRLCWFTTKKLVNEKHHDFFELVT